MVQAFPKHSTTFCNVMPRNTAFIINGLVWLKLVLSREIWDISLKSWDLGVKILNLLIAGATLYNDWCWLDYLDRFSSSIRWPLRERLKDRINVCILNRDERAHVRHFYSQYKNAHGQNGNSTAQDRYQFIVIWLFVLVCPSNFESVELSTQRVLLGIISPLRFRGLSVKRLLGWLPESWLEVEKAFGWSNISITGQFLVIIIRIIELSFFRELLARSLFGHSLTSLCLLISEVIIEEIVLVVTVLVAWRAVNSSLKGFLAISISF